MSKLSKILSKIYEDEVPLEPLPAGDIIPGNREDDDRYTANGGETDPEASKAKEILARISTGVENHGFV